MTVQTHVASDYVGSTAEAGSPELMADEGHGMCSQRDVV